MSVSKLMSCRKFIEEIQDRLSPIYGEPTGYEVGKNKVVFNVNGFEFIVEKSREKSTNERKSVIECTTADMFPCVIVHDISLTDHKYTEEDVNKAVLHIDRFIMSCIDKSYKAALCADYSMLKYALLPMFIGDTTNKELVAETQELILNLMAAGIDDEVPDFDSKAYMQAEKGFAFFFPFYAKDIYTDDNDNCVLFMSTGTQIKLLKCRLKNSQFTNNDKDYTEYILNPDDYPGIQMTTAVKKILRDYYDFKLCFGEFRRIMPDTVFEETDEDEDEAIHELIANHVISR